MTQPSAGALSTLIEIAENPTGYVTRWKTATGGKAIGAFPMNFPAEIAHAAGVLSVVVQESREPITSGRNLLTEFYCGYTRNLADQAARGRLDVYDGFFLADHCIQLLGAVDVVREEGNRPVYFGQLMASMGDPWTRTAVDGKMLSFREELAEFTGRTIGDADLARSIRLFNENRRLLRSVFDARRAGDATFTSAELQALVKSSMVMDKEEHTALVRRALAEARAARRDGRIRLHLSGHFCHAPRPELLRAIEDCGAIVVDDDLFHGTRYISTDVREDVEPLAALSQWYLDRNVSVPCPTRVQHDVDWDAYLLDSVRASGADGVIVLMAKFCEPHMLYYPELRKALNAAGVPNLLIETEHEGLPLESVRTRVEALLERIRHSQLANA